jgi:hypothetical protein
MKKLITLSILTICLNGCSLFDSSISQMSHINTCEEILKLKEVNNYPTKTINFSFLRENDTVQLITSDTLLKGPHSYTFNVSVIPIGENMDVSMVRIKGCDVILFWDNHCFITIFLEGLFSECEEYRLSQAETLDKIRENIL